jgi:hypothetical protein
MYRVWHFVKVWVYEYGPDAAMIIVAMTFFHFVLHLL